MTALAARPVSSYNVDVLRSLAAFCALLIALAGCYAHVPLEAPPASAPVPQRIAAYEELAPTQVHRTQNFVATGYVVSQGLRTTDYMRLKGGAKVHFPEDLLPIVPEGSSTALRAMESVEDRSSASAYSWLFVGSMVGGSALAVAPLFLQDSDSFELPLIPLIAGLGVITVGGLWGGIAMMLKRQSSEDAAADAFATYEEDLRRFMNLCVRDGKVYACELGAQPPPRGGCVPACRSGFICVQGQCRSACNPPCDAGQQCVVEAGGPSCR